MDFGVLEILILVLGGLFVLFGFIGLLWLDEGPAFTVLVLAIGAVFIALGLWNASINGNNDLARRQLTQQGFTVQSVDADGHQVTVRAGACLLDLKSRQVNNKYIVFLDRRDGSRSVVSVKQIRAISKLC